MSKNDRSFAPHSVRALLVLGGCLLSFNAFAQGTSVLFGNVSDAATKAPVADAVVTVTSPSMQGEQVAVTDATGTYRVSQLPPGIYTIRVEKEAYKPYSRGDIEIRADHTIRLNIEILPEALRGEEVVVVGRAPTVDVGSSTLSTNITSDYVRNLAVSRPSGRGGGARSFESLALLAPTAQADTYGVSINGATSPENGYLLDGISVQNPGFGLLGSPVTSEFIEEVNVITGGYLPEYGRSIGGVLSAVTKSGSNEFHGSVFGTFSPGAMAGTPETVTRLGNATAVVPNVYNIGDLGATVGGPIQHDRLWFFAGFQPSFTRFQLQKNFNRLLTTSDGRSYADADGNPVSDQGKAATRPIDGASQNYFVDKKQYQYIGKLTFLANQDNRISLSVVGTPSTAGGGNSFQINNNTGQPPTTFNTGLFSAIATKNTQTSTDVGAKWTSSFLEKRVLLDTTVGWHRENLSSLPSDGTAVGSSQGLAGVSQIRYRRTVSTTTTPPRQNHSILDFENNPDLGTSNPALAAVCAPIPGGVSPCPVTTYNIGGPGFIDESTQDIWQGKIIGTYLFPALGHHVFKAGFDSRLLQFDHHKSYSGGVIYRESRSGTTFADYREYGFLRGPDDPVILTDYTAKSKSTIVGGFIQDSWSILDLVTLNVGLRFDTQTAQGPDAKTGFTVGNQWSPRIGAVYDFTRQGRSKIYANYARFYEDIPLDALDREFPGERQIQATRSCNPSPPFSNCRPGGDNNATIVPTNGPFPNRLWSVVGGDTTIDPNLKAQSSDEIVAGAEYEIFPSARLGASYTRRYFNYVIEDMSLDEANTYFLGNPGYGIASTFPKAVRNYNGFNFYLTKTFSDLWLGQVSYTYSTLSGNYAGLFRPETGQLDPNINSDFDLISLLSNRSGALPGDFQHQFKAFVAKEFIVTGPASVSLGLGYLAHSGGPISALGSHPVYGNGEAFLIPRGAAGRLPWVHSIDPHFALNYRVARDSVITVNLDVFNVFNFQAATVVDENWTFSDALPLSGGTTQDLDVCASGSGDCQIKSPGGTALTATDKNPNFKNPTQYQSPRIFRFGARFTF